MAAGGYQQLDPQRTIVAVGSGSSAARRGIVRLSGPATAELLTGLLGRPPAAARAVAFAAQADIGWQGRRLDVHVCYWPDHRSYTGQPCAELHLLGALPLLEALTERLVELGASPAHRGEFTLRSFLAGKLDLPQAEAVLGVIEADSPAELSAALQQLAGNLSQPVRQLRDQLVELTAHLEAGLDFVEEDIEFITAEQLSADVARIAEQLDAISQQLHARASRRRTACGVLVGLPNSGKSSLFNALLGTARAIVSPQAGTTRDALTATLDLDGLSIELVDTAGLEELDADSPRGLAQVVLQRRLQQADVVLLCLDVHQPPDQVWVQAECQRLQAEGRPVLLVGTKCDLPHSAVWPAAECDALVSAMQPASLDGLRRRLRDSLADSLSHLQADALQATAIRCRGSIEPARQAVCRAAALVELAGGEELVATELRIAIDELSAVIGEVHSEDILGNIFGRFCIGK